MVEYRPARREDLEAICALLTACGLSPEGVADWLDTFWVALDDGALVGVAGLERYGDVTLLRSVATHPAYRGRGVAAALCRRLLALAQAQGVRTVYLLTQTAEGYFRRFFGFRAIPRAAADPRLQASLQFARTCPDSAVLMALELEPLRPQDHNTPT
ncbi:MAG: arsenic resistance N-acetyltransferase ArsN2 [Armatimonadetes bacterium]|nr:arsenic resistance N-acetyltransferase ArsN2 [Armatimonadota bacterium]MDW8153745.1 arsenic resistance N-acetyltransferase ArsN2 [Armatimonadota bacterium]